MTESNPLRTDEEIDRWYDETFDQLGRAFSTFYPRIRGGEDRDQKGAKHLMMVTAGLHKVYVELCRGEGQEPRKAHTFRDLMNYVEE